MPHACSAHDIAESVKQQLVDSAWHRPPPLPRQEPVSTHTNVQVRPHLSIPLPIPFFIYARLYTCSRWLPQRVHVPPRQRHTSLRRQVNSSTRSPTQPLTPWRRRRHGRGGGEEECVYRVWHDAKVTFNRFQRNLPTLATTLRDPRIILPHLLLNTNGQKSKFIVTSLAHRNHQRVRLPSFTIHRRPRPAIGGQCVPRRR